MLIHKCGLCILPAVAAAIELGSGLQSTVQMSNTGDGLMKTEKRQTYLTPKVIRLGVIAATLLIPFGLLLAFFGASFSIDYRSGAGICIFIPGIIIAVGLPLYLTNARRRLQAFTNDARVSTAEILHLESKAAKGVNSAYGNDLITLVLFAVGRLEISEARKMDYFLTFQFDTEGSDNTLKPVKLKAKVSQEFYNSCNLGERTQVRYARAYPRVAYLKGETGYHPQTTF
jgi:hypothetical protein